MGGIPTRNYRNNHHPSIIEQDYSGEQTLLDNRHKLLLNKMGDVQLFDLETDPAETTDIADTKPDMTRRLQQKCRSVRRPPSKA